MPNNNKRLGLCIIAVAMTILGVLTGSLWLVGGGVAATVATWYGLSETYTLPRMAGHYGLLLGALLLSAITCILVFQNFENPIINLLWFTAMIMAIFAALRFDRTLPIKITTTRHDNKFLKKHALVIPIILIAFALRFSNLETLPPLHGDEGEMGLAALKVLNNEAPPLTAVGWMDHPAPNGRGLLVIALPDQVDNLEAIEQRIPGGTVWTRLNPRNDPIYTVYHVPGGHSLIDRRRQ